MKSIRGYFAIALAAIGAAGAFVFWNPSPASSPPPQVMDRRCRGGFCPSPAVGVLPVVLPSNVGAATISTMAGGTVTVTRSTTKTCTRGAAYFDAKQLWTQGDDGFGGVAGYAAPDGSATAVLWTDSGSSFMNASSRTTPNPAGSTVFSTHAKYVSSQCVNLVDGNTGQGPTFDIQNGGVLNTPAGWTASMTQAANGFWRLIAVEAAGSLNDTYYVLNNAPCISNTATYTSTGKQTLFWGTKIESGTSATAYVPGNNRQLVTVGVNTACIENAGLLVEGASTNIAFPSQAFDNAFWTKIGSTTAPTVTANAGIAPDGTNTAEKVVFPAVGSGAYSLVRSGSLTATATQWTFSAYVMCPTSTVIYLSGNSGVNYTACSVAANTWTRCTDTRTLLATTYAVDIGWNNPATGTGPGATCYLWGAQFEASPFATSYIPTTTVAVSRAAEDVTVTAPTTSGATGSAAVTYTPEWPSSSPTVNGAVLWNGSYVFYYNGGVSNIISFDGTNVAQVAGLYDGTAHRYSVDWNQTANQRTIYNTAGATNTTPHPGFSGFTSTWHLGTDGSSRWAWGWLSNICLGQKPGMCR